MNRQCPHCRRSRRVTRQLDLGESYWRYTCSQGHTWLRLLTMMERVNEIFKSIYVESIAEAINDNPFQ